METLSEAGECPVGYSSHDRGANIVVSAVSLGAKVIEKHLTLNRDFDGPDHKASSDISEFKQYVSDLNSGFLALGHENKKTMDSEKSMKFSSESKLCRYRILNLAIYNHV